jgi:N-acetyl-anhydromuramyl-L-alanine amidase AmpD
MKKFWLGLLGLAIIFLSLGFFKGDWLENWEKETKLDLFVSEETGREAIASKETTPKNELKEESNAESRNEEKSKDQERPPLGNFQVINRLVSWGFEKREKRLIDTLIIHSSYDGLGKDPYSLTGLLEEYRQYGVAPHYLLDREGKIYSLVEEKNIAFHAGKSQSPDGRDRVNDFSLGIEIMNTKEDQPTAEQYAALNVLVASLKKKYKVKYILGHNQIAPGRKDDPWNFNWKKLND